jgi:GTP-binding protein
VKRKKPLTNMRASGSDKAAALKPPREFSMEMALEYIEDDELVEITPKAIRMRKLYLTESERKKNERKARD